MVCEGWFNIANRLLFLPNSVPLAQGVVPGILPAATEHNGHAANAALCKDGFLTVEEDGDFLRPLSIRHVVSLVENSEGQIKDVRRLGVGAIPLMVLGFVKEGES